MGYTFERSDRPTGSGGGVGCLLEMILAITDGETWREMVLKACGLKFFEITLVKFLFIFYIVHQPHQDTFTKISKRNLMR